MPKPFGGFGLASSLHCSSFLGLPFRILTINLVKPKKRTTMETIGRLGLRVEDSARSLLRRLGSSLRKSQGL